MLKVPTSLKCSSTTQLRDYFFLQAFKSYSYSLLTFVNIMGSLCVLCVQTDNTDGDIPTHQSTRPTAVEEHWKEIKDASHRYSIPQSPLERSQGEPMYAAEPHATIPSIHQQEGGEEISKALKAIASAAIPSSHQQKGGEDISKALKETASAAIPSTHQEVDGEEYSKSLKATARIAIPSTQLEEEFRSAREIMDLEVVRMREDLSRAAFTNERREMEAARAQMEFRLCKEELARMSG